MWGLMIWPTWIELVRQRYFVITLVLSLILGVILCFVPLFDIVGYESSMVVGVFTHLAAVFCTLKLLHQDHTFSPRESQAPAWRLFDFFWIAFVRHLLLILPPALALSLNAFRVPNCDFWQGFGFWILGPPFAVLMGQVAAWVANVLYPKGKRVQYVLAYAIVVLNGLSLGLHILLEPPINGHQWAIGFLNGSIYDEAIRVPAGLLWYRLTNVMLALAVVCGLEYWRSRKVVQHQRTIRGLLGLALLSCVLWIGMTATEQRFGIRIDRDMIAQELGGKVETEHFIIYYPDSEEFQSQLELIKEDHEFRYAEMKAYFHTDPVELYGEKVRSFIYPNTEVKGHLMGARRTLIAKIWLGEIHILWRNYGTHLLAHELAHVFTRPFSSGPLSLSMQNGVGVNMGLVEGIATAADSPPLELTSHEASAAMRRLKIAPDIRGLVGATGFWTQASGRAYTLMGSFVQFLVDKYGIEKFQVVYKHGDFQAAYDTSASELVSQWERMLDAIELTESQLEIARYRYERPSIFGKVCARTIAELKRQANENASSGQLEQAREIYAQIIAHDPLSTNHKLGLARLLMRAEQDKEALKVLDALIAAQGDSLVPAQLASVNELRGDVLWRDTQYDDARRMYGECLKTGVLDNTRRMLLVKQASLQPERSDYRELSRDYLLDYSGDPVSLYYPTMWRYEQPEDPLVAYMLGRRLWGNRKWADAQGHLEFAVAELPSDLLQAEAMLMLAETYTHQALYDKALEVLNRLAKVEWSRLQTEAEEWRARVEFKQSLLK